MPVLAQQSAVRTAATRFHSLHTSRNDTCINFAQTQPVPTCCTLQHRTSLL
jgi:hypothetical protein